MGERCWKCGTPVQWNTGIGAFCPNITCDVVDALEGQGAWDIKIAIPPASAAGGKDHRAATPKAEAELAA
jgi:hypothetical protein